MKLAIYLLVFAATFASDWPWNLLLAEIAVLLVLRRGRLGSRRAGVHKLQYLLRRDIEVVR